jgi:hypothetical protein
MNTTRVTTYNKILDCSLSKLSSMPGWCFVVLSKRIGRGCCWRQAARRDSLLATTSKKEGAASLLLGFFFEISSCNSYGGRGTDYVELRCYAVGGKRRRDALLATSKKEGGPASLLLGFFWKFLPAILLVGEGQTM